jgi:hypothetical protein
MLKYNVMEIMYFKIEKKETKMAWFQNGAGEIALDKRKWSRQW